MENVELKSEVKFLLEQNLLLNEKIERNFNESKKYESPIMSSHRGNYLQNYPSEVSRLITSVHQLAIQNSALFQMKTMPTDITGMSLIT